MPPVGLAPLRNFCRLACETRAWADSIESELPDGCERRELQTEFLPLGASYGTEAIAGKIRLVPISTLLIDEHRLFRAGLRKLLEENPDIAVIADVLPGLHALEQVQSCRADVLVIGTSPDRQSMNLWIAELLSGSPSNRVVVILNGCPKTDVSRLLAMGISACVDHDCTVEELLTAIRRTHRGTSFLSARVAERFVAGLVSISPARPFGRLSMREAEVARMVAAGLRSKEIALRMAVSAATVATFRHRLFKKLNVRSDAELTRLALREEFVQEP